MGTTNDPCEIIPYLIPFTLNITYPVTFLYLYFKATRNGEADQPTICQSESTGTVMPEEIELIRQGRMNLEQTSDRKAALAGLHRELEAAGWQYVGQGTHWYSARFLWKGAQ